MHFVTQRDNWVSMEPDAAPCLHAFDYHPVCYFIYNIIIMHLTIIFYVLLHLRHHYHYHPLCPSPSTTSSMLTLCLKKIVAYNTWMLFLENKRLLPTSGSCFCLAWLWWRAKFWSSIQSSLLTISIILHFTGQLPNPVAAGLLGSQMGILTRLGWCKLLVTRCSAHSNSSSTQRSRPYLLQQVHAHQHWEQGQLATLTFASIVYSHSHWQPNFDPDAFR